MKGFKTIAFNIITGILLLLQTQGDMLDFISPQVIAYITIIGNFILRFITTTPVGQSESKTVVPDKETGGKV